MAAVFDASLSQRLVCGSTPLPDTGYPFTVGVWFMLAAAGTSTRVVWAFADTSSTLNYIRIVMGTTELITLEASDSITSASATIGTTIPAATWIFCLARLISSTSRRVHLHWGGRVLSAANTSDRNPASLDTLTIGGMTHTSFILPWDGKVGEFWITNSDVQPEDAAISSAHMFQLAYGGPFSIPHLADHVIEYRSMRESPHADRMGEMLGRHAWSNVNGVSLGPHPPLPYWYKRPSPPIIMPADRIVRHYDVLKEVPAPKINTIVTSGMRW